MQEDRTKTVGVFQALAALTVGPKCAEDSTIKRLETRPPSVDVKDACGRTLLHRAAAAGRLLDVLLCLQHGAEVNVPDNSGWTAIHEAAAHDQRTVLLFLLAHDGQVDIQGQEGKTPLHVAAACDHLSAVMLLLEQGGNPTVADKLGQYPCQLASSERVRAALITAMRTRLEVTALHEAVNQGNVAAAGCLISMGADLEEKNDNGCTPLHIACVASKFDIAKLLVLAGANVDAITAQGDTPLHYAAYVRNAPLVQTLLKAGADPQATNTDGLLPKDLTQGNVEINALLDNKEMNQKAKGSAAPHLQRTHLCTARSLSRLLRTLRQGKRIFLQRRETRPKTHQRYNSCTEIPDSCIGPYAATLGPTQRVCWSGKTCGPGKLRG